jgi:hypothetical protein
VKDGPDSLICSDEEIEQLKELACSTTAGIWRIKRAKVLLGALEGIDPARLMHQVRVPVLSIVKCIREFTKHRMAHFERPDRNPTAREAAVERMLAFLDNPPDSSDLWDTLRLRYIGTDFTARDIHLIRRLIVETHNPSRAGIARLVCRQKLQLVDPLGNCRFPVAYDILRRMEMDNVIRFPNRKAPRSLKLKTPRAAILPDPGVLKVDSHQPMELVFVTVKNREESLLWNAVIHHYHYIDGHRLFGPQLRYLVYCRNSLSTETPPPGSVLLGALSFSSCAWRVSSRDAFIGWNDAQRIANLPLVINNSRFLILPWIRVPNLASRILGTIARQAPRDWEARYGRKPVLMETFVERDRFRGTCYRAANWIDVGDTVGYSLHGHKKRRQQPLRSVFLFPLHRDFRKILCR